MTANETLLKRVIQDAIEMLRWQARQPVGANSWNEWVTGACAAIEEVQHAHEDTQIFTSPFTKRQLREAMDASRQAVATW